MRSLENVTSGHATEVLGREEVQLLLFLNLGSRSGVSGQHHAPAVLYPPDKEPPVPTVGPRAGLEAEVLGLSGIEPRSSGPYSKTILRYPAHFTSTVLSVLTTWLQTTLHRWELEGVLSAAEFSKPLGCHFTTIHTPSVRQPKHRSLVFPNSVRSCTRRKFSIMENTSYILNTTIKQHR
jgi:hypothetical protein